MVLSKATNELLASLDTISNHGLVCRNDLGAVIELASRQNQLVVLDELSFAAKFVSKAFGIMQRLERHDEGYERVSHEFTETLKKIRALLSSILDTAPIKAREQFTLAYLAMSHESLQRLLLLCKDLAWYKNWMIDHREDRWHGGQLP